MNPLIFFLLLLAFCLAFSGVGSALETGRFYDKHCEGGRCIIELFQEPRWVYTGYSWKKVGHHYLVNDSLWIAHPYDGIDYRTWVWVEYVEGDRAYVCLNVSDEMAGVPIPFTKGNVTNYYMFVPRVSYCNLYAIKDFSFFKLGEESTTFYLFGSDEDGFTEQRNYYNGTSANEYNLGLCRGTDPRPCHASAIIDNALCQHGNCLHMNHNNESDDAVGPYSTAWNRTFDMNASTNINVTFWWKVGKCAGVEADEDVYFYHTRINDSVQLQIGKEEDACSGDDCSTNGTYTYLVSSMPDAPVELVFGCYSDDVSAVTEWTWCSVDNISIEYTESAADSTPPDIKWLNPTTNLTQMDNNQSYFEWNISVNESMTICEFEINGTNQSGTQVDAGTSSYCWYNETGFNNNATTCALGWADDTSSNLNVTTHMYCVNINITHVTTDSTPPDVNWIDPTANGTEADNKTYIVWNISLTENGECEIEINGTNHTGTETNATADTYCSYNETGFTGNVTSCAYGYGVDGSGNWNATAEYVCRTMNISHTYHTRVDVVFVEPTLANGTEAVNKSYITWNISVLDNIASAFIEINGTNQTCTQVDAGADSYCYYNETGLTSNQTRCAWGYATNQTRMNMTVNYTCRTIHYYTPSTPAAPAPTVCDVEPLLIFEEGIRIAWRFDCGQNVISGDLTVDGYLIIDWLDMEERAAPATPPTNTLRLYVEQIKGFGFYKFIDDTGMKRQLVRDSIILVKNIRGTSIAANRIVYDTGSEDNIPTVDTAKADNISTMPAIGVTIEAIANGSYGRVMQVGLLENINTNTLTEGDILYVSDETAGVPKTTAPLTPNLTQEIGTVLVKSATAGAIQIVARGLTGDEHGTTQNVFHVGNTTVQSGIQLYDENANARCMRCWSDGVCNSTAGAC